MSQIDADAPSAGLDPMNDFADQSAGQLFGAADTSGANRSLETILRIPVSVQVVLGSAKMAVANLMKLGRGAVISLDHRVGEPVDVVVNGRIVARGEVVVIEDDNSRFGVSLTEIVGPNSSQPSNGGELNGRRHP
jgi:flagellar motor switch protein FliN